MAKDTTTSKKHKRDSAGIPQTTEALDTSKPTAVYRPSKGRAYTVSVALPGSIIANAQTHEIKTQLAGQIARALAVFSVDEVVIFDDGATPPRRQDSQLAAQDEANGYTAFSNPGDFLYHILSYLETPPYLRKALFGYHPNLRTAGTLHSLDMPHHLKAEEWCQYREGVTLSEDEYNGYGGQQRYNGDYKNAKRRIGTISSNGDSQRLTQVNVGFVQPVIVDAPIPPNTRVTLRFDSPTAPDSNDTAPLSATAVAPEAPREEKGYYWGYTARRANSLAEVFTESPFETGYDFSIGTSERGIPLQKFLSSSKHGVDAEQANGSTSSAPKWQHLLITFGGLAGLEKALQNDPILSEKVSNASEIFDAWINLLEGQGSRTIRTEEALWIGLMGLRPFVVANEEDT